MSNIFLEIDQTISPRIIKDHHYKNYGPFIKGVVSGYQILVPEYIVEFLKDYSSNNSRIYTLSKWGSKAEGFGEVFGFKTRNIMISDYTERTGMLGKMDALKKLVNNRDVCLDAQFSIAHQKVLGERGVLAIPPSEKNACLNRRNIERVREFAKINE